MAVGRLSERARASNAIWPGFVDAMTALLLVLMFVLSIFMLVQFVLRATISGQEDRIEQQENQLDNLSSQLSELSNVLAMEQARGDDLQAELGVARSTLGERNDEIGRLGALVSALSNDKTSLEARVASFEVQVASLLAEQSSLQADVAALEDDKAAEIDAKEALQVALAQARSELDEGAEAARLAAARREALEELVASLEADKAANAEAIDSLKASEAANLALIAALESDKSSAESRVVELEQAQIDALARIETLDDALSEEERLKLAEIAAAEALRERLQSADAELTAMTLALEERRKEAEETLTLLAAAEAARDQLEATQTDLLSDLDENAARLALARRLAEDQASEISEKAKNLALLNEQAVELREQLATLSAQLAASEEQDRAQQIELANLGSRLNAALARELQLKAREADRLKKEAESLEAYRSEFFGEMRKALGDRRDIRIVGDRFIFQSEVLFSSGSALLDPAGRQELAELGAALRDVIARIPAEIDWLLVVEGHTDDVAFSSTGKYADNWELSQGRALSVVRFLSDQAGVPADRLAALGYGEYQPVDPASTAAARARNRRIELKFTERPGAVSGAPAQP